MASASSFLSEDQFLCSVCLDVFTEPVSIPCGHNFCKACISRHWEGKQQCQCPLCNEKFNKGLKLCVNTAFREIVENFKKHHQETSGDNNRFLVKPGQVPCDCCLGNKFRASKTCLVCLASYCEKHLEPHQSVEALKRHTLSEPVQNLEDKICRKHNRILELFCKNDLTCICALCTDHSEHDTVPLERAFVNKKGHVGKKKAEVEGKRKSGKKAQKSKAAMQPKRKDEVTPRGVVSNQMQAPHIWWFPGDPGPHHFTRYPYVPGNRGFPEWGSCFEIQVKLSTCWHLGVFTESVFGESTFTPIPMDGHWLIRCKNNSTCKTLPNDPDVHLYLIKKPNTVLVFVDHKCDLVSSYDPDTDIQIHSLICHNHNIISLFFPFGPIENANWVQRLIKQGKKIIERSQLSHNSFSNIAVCIVLLILSVIIEILTN
ncbi:E3 ubiquitin-protein ligase TRIM17-like [Anabas testudineus]|uniref:E3 ubiquitin-protein ligase TRIM17-like n=1 Tax=Anabas testudineus TaxID=64144 RepID=UPI000E4561B9|nr:E3 ubiquitin-protein ligase TRIM17-like [Anabas testudineus]